MAVVVGGHNSHYIGRGYGANENTVGYVNNVRIYDAADLAVPIASTVEAEYLFEDAPATDGKSYIVLDDSATYKWHGQVPAHSNSDLQGLFAGYGKTPKLQPGRGATAGTYGARPTGRTKFSTGAAGTFYYISKSGNDSTGARGNSALPFLTIQAALDNGSRLNGDTIQIQDSETYREDIDVGALDVTIQAANGKVPKLVGVDTSGTGNNITGTATTELSLYGLTFEQPAGASSTNEIVDSFRPDALEIYDCSFLAKGQFFNMTHASEAGSVEVHNSLFVARGSSSTNQSAFHATGGLNVSNSYFENIFLAVSNDDTGSGPTNSNLPTVDFCNFVGAAGVSGLSGGLLCTNSIIDNSTELFVLVAYTNQDLVFENCQFTERQTYKVGATIGVLSRYTSCLFGNGLLYFSDDPYTITGIMVVDSCVVTSSDEDAVGVSWEPGSASSAAALFVDNCVLLNATNYSIRVRNRSGVSSLMSAFLDGCAEKGAGVSFGAISGGTGSEGIEAINTVYASAVGDVQVDGSFNENPRLISDASNTANSALSAAGAGNFLSPVGLVYRHATCMSPVLSLRFKTITVCGITFAGSINFHGGVYAGRGADRSLVEYCSFGTLGPYGVFLGSEKCIVRRNLFTNMNGQCVALYGLSGYVSNNVASSCKGAFLSLGGNNATISNNSSHLCEFGQADKGVAFPFIEKNNIYIGSGSADYSGNATLTYSAVGTLAGGGSIGAKSTRRDPLFRNRGNDDLRLRAIEVSGEYDSPAKSAGSDGYDMGAFPMFYGPALASTYSVDFSTSGWFNPDTYLRNGVPVGLAEGARKDATYYSRMDGRKVRHVFQWQDHNPMPDAQLEAIIALWSLADPDVEMSLDGGTTWLPVTLLREEGHQYTDLTGGYTDDEVPTPINQLVVVDR